MKQIFQNPKTGKLEIEEITPPRLKKGGVLVKNYFSLISPGTEKGIIELSKKSLIQKAKERPDYVQKFLMLIKTKGLIAAWQMVQSKLESRLALGYSSSGKILKVGSDIEEFQVGDRVACAGQDYASHAEVIFVPKNLCVKIPDNVSDKEAAFSTIGAIALQGIRRAKLTSGEKVAIIGLGLLGQLALKILKAYGYPVIGFDINEEQVNFAKENGLDKGVVIGKDSIESTVNSFTNNIGVDAVLIYASAKTDKPLKIAVEISRDKGRIVQIGSILSNIPWRDFYKKELDFYSSRSYGPGRYDSNYEEAGQDYPISYVRWTEKRNMEEFLRLLSERRIGVDNLIDYVFPIEEAEKAYELVFDSKKLVRGILLSYNFQKEQPNTIYLKEELKNYPLKRFINIGLIGLGSFARSVILPNLKKIKNVRLFAISTGKGKLAKDIGQKINVNYISSDYRKLIEDKKIDLIICATSHSSHKAIVEEALLVDKNIYVEKPLCLNEKDLKEIMEVAEKSKGRLMVGFNRRFSYHFKEAKKEFLKVKTPLMIFYRINAGPLKKDHWIYDLNEGGRILGEVCHFVDALQFLVDSEPKTISANLISKEGIIFHEENLIANIEYKNYSLGTIFYSALGNFKLPKEYIEIYGDNKIMIIDDFKNGKVVYPNKIKSLRRWHQDKGYKKELEIFIDSIKNSKSSPISLKELYLSHLTLFKIVEAAKEKKTIKFD